MRSSPALFPCALRKEYDMKTLGNLIWLIFFGLILALLWVLAGIVCCITIIGIPFGIQCFKLAGLSLWPFGKEIIYGSMGVGGFLGNILWILFFGWELAVAHLIAGLICCVTIIGIPFGLQCFKIAQVAILPFGASYKQY